MRALPFGCLLLAAALISGQSAAAPPLPSPEPDPWFGPDKAMHFAGGFAFSLAGYGLGSATFDSRWGAVALSTSFGLAAGGAKEGLDALGLGSPSWRDFAWTAVGSVLGVGLAATFDAALRGP